MKNEVFEKAVESAQMLMLLAGSKAIQQNKSLTKTLSAIRSKVDENVFFYKAIDNGWMTADVGNDATKTKLETFFNAVHNDIRNLVRDFDMEALLKGDDLRTVIRKKIGTSRLTKPYEAHGESILEEPYFRQPYTLTATTRHRDAIAMRGPLLHTWSSVVRNGSWLGAVTALRFPDNKLFSLSSSLMNEHGSRIGAEQYVQKRTEFVNEVTPALQVEEPKAGAKSVRGTTTTTKAGPIRATDIVVTVGLDISLLKRDGPLRDIAHKLSKTAAGTRAFEEIWLRAMEPVKVPMTGPTSISNAAKSKYETLIEEAQVQVAALEAAAQKAATERENKEKEEALKALATLGPHLKVLRKHPELLQGLNLPSP